jgi:hypothetical protein
MREITVFLFVIAGGLILWFFMTRERAVRYRRRPVLTGSGLEFFHRLQRALPACAICPQVAVTALLEPAGIGKARKAALDLIVGKRVGYAVFDEELELIAVVELDYRARLTRRETVRDGWFASAGIKVVRFHVKHLPSETKIQTRIYAGIAERQEHCAAYMGGRDDNAIEFRRPKAPWSNTVNAHM